MHPASNDQNKNAIREYSIRAMSLNNVSTLRKQLRKRAISVVCQASRWATIINCRSTAHWCSWLTRCPLKAEITGSSPVCATKQTNGHRRKRWPLIFVTVGFGISKTETSPPVGYFAARRLREMGCRYPRLASPLLAGSLVLVLLPDQYH